MRTSCPSSPQLQCRLTPSRLTRSGGHSRPKNKRTWPVIPLRCKRPSQQWQSPHWLRATAAGTSRLPLALSLHRRHSPQPHSRAAATRSHRHVRQRCSRRRSARPQSPSSSSRARQPCPSRPASQGHTKLRKAPQGRPTRPPASLAPTKRRHRRRCQQAPPCGAALAQVPTPLPVSARADWRAASVPGLSLLSILRGRPGECSGVEENVSKALSAEAFQVLRT
mmetsp:Transcript_66710/g.154974  ORF Transcript_66710/g.154974 Transcript_66710/m.154974 type:complete len:223 (-) Transcript_66710:71-739(-)